MPRTSGEKKEDTMMTESRSECENERWESDGGRRERARDSGRREKRVGEKGT